MRDWLRRDPEPVISERPNVHEEGFCYDAR
jgi:hypothetical protein